MSNKRFKTQVQKQQNRSQRQRQEQSPKADAIQSKSEMLDIKGDMMERIIAMASQQKFLPKIIYQLEHRCGDSRKTKFLQYQKLIKNIYGQQGRVPLKYNPQEALTHRQKFRIKVQKLQNHELEIDYFQKMKTRQGKLVPLYKCQPLQKVNYETKKEYIMFRDFNQAKFRKSYTQIFQDKLQLKQQSLVKKERNRTTAAIQLYDKQQNTGFLPNPKFNKINHRNQFQDQNTKKPSKFNKVKLRSLTQAVQVQKTEIALPVKPFNQKYKPHIVKLTIGKRINDIQNQFLHQKMLKIGNFPASVGPSAISLTRQSLAKYLKSIYQRQIRIMDFMQVQPAFNMQQYNSLCTKLKLMPIQHIIFMCFVFYDFNNDGFICDNDIRRIRDVCQSKKSNLVEEDLKKILALKERNNLRRKSSQNQSNEQHQIPDHNQFHYLELYKLPQITESTYFNWLHKFKTQKSPIKQISEEDSDQKAGQVQQQSKEESKQEQKDQTQLKRLDRVKRKSSGLSNSSNLSVLKFRNNFHDETSQTRKYLLGIKASKTYISFEEFKGLYCSKQSSKKFFHSVQPSSRVIQVSKASRGDISNVPKQDSRVSSLLGSFRYKEAQVLNKQLGAIQKQLGSIQREVGLVKKQKKQKYKEYMHKPLLWYDLIDKLAGVRFEGLKYE